MIEDFTPPTEKRTVTVGITHMEVVGPNWMVEISRASRDERDGWAIRTDVPDFYRHPGSGSYVKRVKVTLDDAVFLARSEAAPLIERLAKARREVFEAEQALDEWCRGS